MRQAELVGLLERCLPIIRHDAQMMADITRHSPLPIEAQAVHDSTEYESEKLMREIPAALTALKSGAVVLCDGRDTERLNWMDTLQHRFLSHGGKTWPISTDCHAQSGSWAIYLRSGIGSEIADNGFGATIRDAIDRAMLRAGEEK